jgi:hypothetical protein
MSDVTNNLRATRRDSFCVFLATNSRLFNLPVLPDHVSLRSPAATCRAVLYHDCHFPRWTLVVLYRTKEKGPGLLRGLLATFRGPFVMLQAPSTKRVS